MDPSILLIGLNRPKRYRSMLPPTIQIDASESTKSVYSKHDGESTSDPSQFNANTRSDGSTSNGSLDNKETKAVNRTKLLVYICLLFAGVAISLAAYFFAKNKEDSEFEAEVR